MLRGLAKGFAVLTVFASSFSVSAHGQCNQVNQSTILCDGPNGCAYSVTIGVPMPSQYGQYISSSTVSCCAGKAGTVYPVGGCQGTHGLLHPPIMKIKLVQLAKLQPILIVNCTGGYDPYQDKPLTSFVLRDSVATQSKVEALK